MFFTLIIPAWNCEKTIDRLLNSIVAQLENDLKVIIIDDSDENHSNLYEDYIKKYEKELNIEYYPRRNDLYTIHCPGNTRHDGLRRALEEDTKYILFADCDDELKLNTLSHAKEEIIKYDYPNLIYSNIEEYSEDNDDLPIDEIENTIWIHGNFYKKEFIQKYNINFKIDLKTSEDIYFQNYIWGFLSVENALICKIPPFYKWYNRLDSTSHQRANTRLEHLSYCFPDLLIAFFTPFKELYQMYPEHKDFLLKSLILTFENCYFYIQQFLFYKKYNLAKQNLQKLKEELIIILDLFEVSIIDIIQIAYSDPNAYNEQKEQAEKSLKMSFIEETSLYDFLLNLKI